MISTVFEYLLEPCGVAFTMCALSKGGHHKRTTIYFSFFAAFKQLCYITRISVQVPPFILGKKTIVLRLMDSFIVRL